MGYYDPYAYQDFYDYDPYGYDQPVDDSPPPEPSKDWVDVPRVNATYVRKIPRNVILKDFDHLNTEQLFVLEVLVEHVNLNDNLKPEGKEKFGEEILTSLDIMNFPKVKLKYSEDVISQRPATRVGTKLETRTATVTKSATAISSTYHPLAELFQRLLSHTAKIADGSKKEPESEDKEPENEDKEEKFDEAEVSDMKSHERKPTLNEKQNENATEETTKRERIEIMEGNSVLLMLTGLAMIQKLQTQDVKVAVERKEVIESEEDTTTEMFPLGISVNRFSQNFYEAVLRQGATKSTYTNPLVGEEGMELGDVTITVTLVSMGKGVEFEMSEGSEMYKKVELIKSFPPEKIESIFDPVVHPRLAVTLMNLEPPLGLNRTSSEILQKYFECKSTPFEGDEVAFLSRHNAKDCRWLEIAREVLQKPSKGSYNSIFPSKSSIKNMKVKSFYNPINLMEVDQEVKPLWRQLKKRCEELWEEADEIENSKKAMLDELEDLLRQDKGDGWGDDASVSKKSKNSEAEERVSKTSTERGSKTSTGSRKVSTVAAIV